jgi:hypothetical protein
LAAGFDHGGERIDRLLGLALGEMDDRAGHAHLRDVSLLLADLGECRACSVQPAHPRLRLDQVRAPGDGERVFVREQPLHPLRGEQR